jgi:hypothetical protein
MTNDDDKAKAERKIKYANDPRRANISGKNEELVALFNEWEDKFLATCDDPEFPAKWAKAEALVAEERAKERAQRAMDGIFRRRKQRRDFSYPRHRRQRRLHLRRSAQRPGASRVGLQGAQHRLARPARALLVLIGNACQSRVRRSAVV